MTNALDPRIVEVGIAIGGEITWYTDLYMTARGTKFGNQNANECQVRIDNLNRAHRDFILKETSPFLPVRAHDSVGLIVNAGRKSYGASRLFIGNITVSQVTQPPDIGIILNAITGFSYALNTVAISFPGQTPLRVISQTAANNLGLTLNFQAQDKNIANYSFTGTPLTHIGNIAQTGNVDAFVDNQTLVVKDKNVPLQEIVKILNLNTGMIGVPEVTETGVRVKMLLDNTTQLGGLLALTSKLNPALNGNYVIQKLDFDVSNRDEPFFWIAECGYIG